MDRLREIRQQRRVPRMNEINRDLWRGFSDEDGGVSPMTANALHTALSQMVDAHTSQRPIFKVWGQKRRAFNAFYSHLNRGNYSGAAWQAAKLGVPAAELNAIAALLRK